MYVDEVPRGLFDEEAVARLMEQYTKQEAIEVINHTRKYLEYPNNRWIIPGEDRLYTAEKIYEHYKKQKS